MKYWTGPVLALFLLSCSLSDPFLAPIRSASEVTLNCHPLTLVRGFSTTFFPVVSPQTVLNTNVLLRSSDPSVLAVDGGRVTGLAPGTVSLTATAVAGETSCQLAVSVVDWTPANLAGDVTHLAGPVVDTHYLDANSSAARFLSPKGVCQVGNTLYITDQGNGCVRAIDLTSGNVTTFASGLTGPYGICSDGTSLFVTGEWTGQVWKVDIFSQGVTLMGTSFGSGLLRGIAVWGDTLYIAAAAGHVLYAMDKNTEAAYVFAGSYGNPGSQDGYGGNALFNGPTGVTANDVAVYVTDCYNSAIRKISVATQQVTTLTGTLDNIEDPDGQGLSSWLDHPTGITLQSGRLVFVTNWGARVRQYSFVSGKFTTVAGSYLKGYQDASGSAARFMGLGGLGGTGEMVYAADTEGNTIRSLFVPTKVVTTLAGACLVGSTDGTGTSARFNNPTGLAFDGSSLLVLDTSNSTIRRIDPATGTVRTLAGQSGVFDADDGRGTRASFNGIENVCTDGVSLFVLDNWGHTVRRVVISTGDVTTLDKISIGDMNANALCTDGVSLYMTTYAGELLKFNIETGARNVLATGFSANTDQKLCTTGSVLYVAENSTIYAVDPVSGLKTVFLSSISCSAVCTDGSSLYVASGGRYVSRIDLATQAVTLVAGDQFSSGDADGTGASATFQQPSGICLLEGVLYLTDRQNHNIRAIR